MTSHRKDREFLEIVKQDKKIGGDKPVWVITTITKKGEEKYSSEKVFEYENFIAKAVACGANPVLWVAPTSMNPQNPGFVLPTFFEIPEFSNMVSTYFSFIKYYQDLFFNLKSFSSFEVKTEPQVFTVGYRKNNNFVLHLINLQEIPVKNLKIIIKDKVKNKDIKFVSPENPKGESLHLSKEKFIILPFLKKWGVLINENLKMGNGN